MKSGLSVVFFLVARLRVVAFVIFCPFTRVRVGSYFNDQTHLKLHSWILYYNTERPHSAPLRMLSPLAYEAQLTVR